MCTVFLERPGGQEQVTGPSALLFALLGGLKNGAVSAGEVFGLFKLGERE